MKKFLFLLVFICYLQNTFAQKNIVGTWYGTLKVPKTTIRINFNISQKDTTLITTMDSPDQGAFGIPTDKTRYKDKKIAIYLNAMLVNFKGKLENDTIKGAFTQRGVAFPLNLTKNKSKAPKQKSRLQDPKKPYPYISEDVVFTNKKADNIKLSGTLTLPKNVKNPIVVVLISGSGPQNRDEEVKQFNHRAFLVLSDFLTKNGIAVLRYDDRGIAKSEGNFKTATTLDFATDASSAIDYLKSRKDVNFSKIGLIGHSEGGLIAPIVASKRKDIDFIILLAGPGVDGGKILESQNRKISALSGVPENLIEANEIRSKKIHSIVKQAKNTNEIKEKLTRLLERENLPDNAKKQLLDAYTDKWLVKFVQLNPQDYLQKVTCPILALNGSKDVQVLPKLNLNGIKKATKNNKQVTAKEIKDLNHLFQPCVTGMVNEYATIETTFSPKAMQEISTWIHQLKL